MLRLLKNKRAQNTIEYALIIAVVVGAFTVMQLYNRRAINMRVKKGMDKLPLAVLSQEGSDINGNLAPKQANGDPGTPLIGTDGSFLGDAKDLQYEPYYYTGEYNMTTLSTEGKEKAAYADDGGQRVLSGRTSQRTGKQEISGTAYRD
jgi:hypothetical protein